MTDDHEPVLDQEFVTFSYTHRPTGKRHTFIRTDVYNEVVAERDALLARAEKEALEAARWHGAEYEAAAMIRWLLRMFNKTAEISTRKFNHGDKEADYYEGKAQGFDHALRAIRDKEHLSTVLQET